LIMNNTDLVEAKQDALERVVTRVVCLLMLEVATRLTPVLGQEGSTQPRAIIFRSATFHGCFSSTPRFGL
jgi:hypothetical protein